MKGQDVKTIEKDQTGDWWNEISEAQKASIERGLKDLEEGKTIPHEEMVKFYSKWLSK